MLKKKILIRIGSLRHGGAEKVLVTFLKNIPPHKYEIDLLLNLHFGKYLADVPPWINVLYLHKGEMITTNRLQDIPVKAFRVIYQKILKVFPWFLYRFILKGKLYDVEFAAIQGIYKEILNSPIKTSRKIVWIHTDMKNLTAKKFDDEKLKKFFRFDKIMVNSDEVLEDFKKLAFNDDHKNRLQRIYNTVDTVEILEKSLEFKQKTTFDNPVFIAIGTIYKAKGYERLLRNHQILIQQGYCHTIVIVGDGVDMLKIKNYCKTLNIVDSVKFLGYIPNPYPYLKQADFFILSSLYEGFPTVLLEAMVLKKKIITTNVPGAKEILNFGKLGLIVENSEEGIYQGMKQIYLYRISASD